LTAAYCGTRLVQSVTRLATGLRVETQNPRTLNAVAFGKAADKLEKLLMATNDYPTGPTGPTGPQVRSIPGVIGSSIEAPPNYPDNPAQSPTLDPNPSAGVPANIDKVVQGMVIMQGCPQCGRAFPSDQFSSHVQAENESPYTLSLIHI